MLRYAIIGAGMMGQEHIRNIALLDDCCISHVVDPDSGMREQATALARSLGSDAVQSCETIDRFLVDPQADCAVVAAPNFLHFELLEKLLPGSLPLLVEKPVCTRPDHIDVIRQMAQQRLAPVWVAMEYRYMPPTSRFLEKIAAGEIGSLKMFSIREHRYPFLEKVNDWNRFNEKTGGTMVEKCCHYFDLMRLVTGAEPIRLFASGGVDVNHLDETYNGQVPDIVDNAFAIVDFDNGSRAALDLCMFTEGSNPQETLTAIGDRAKLEARIPGPDRFWPDAPHQDPELVSYPRAAEPAEREVVSVDENLRMAGDHHGSTFYQHQKFASAVRERLPVEVTVEDGLRAVLMGVAAEKSMSTGAAVDISF